VVNDFIVKNCRGSGEKHYVMTPLSVAKETTVEESMINDCNKLFQSLHYQLLSTFELLQKLSVFLPEMLAKTQQIKP